jgi:hypothetical protein
MTLAELHAAWQQLRTAALGRSGFEEHVSPELASRVTQGYAGFYQWYLNQGPMTDVLGSVDPETLGWVKRYRDLAFDVSREGLTVPELGTTAGEQIADVAADVGGFLGKAVAAIAGVGLIAWVLSRKRGR